MIEIVRRFNDLQKPVSGPRATNAKFPWDSSYNSLAATPDHVETVGYCIEAMSILATFYQIDMDLRVKYMYPELGISELLTVVLDRSPVDLGENLNSKMRSIRARLSPEVEDAAYAEKVKEEVSYPGSTSTPELSQLNQYFHPRYILGLLLPQNCHNLTRISTHSIHIRRLLKPL